jgi:hypothetical protein
MKVPARLKGLPSVHGLRDLDAGQRAEPVQKP